MHLVKHKNLLDESQNWNDQKVDADRYITKSDLWFVSICEGHDTSYLSHSKDKGSIALNIVYSWRKKLTNLFTTSPQLELTSCEKIDR